MIKTYSYLLITIIINILIVIFTPLYANDFSPFNMINPNKWFDNRRDDYGPYDEPLPPPPPPPLPYYPTPYGIPYAIPYTVPHWNNYPPPVTPTLPNSPPVTVDTEDFTTRYSKDQMAHRIKELETRLEEIEANNRPSISKPATPSSKVYPSYSGDQTFDNTKSAYPFRPLDLEH